MMGINLAGKLATFSEYYRPKTVGLFNGHDLMAVKIKGPFTWHKHDDTDDFFLVLKGQLTIQGTPNTGDRETAASRALL